MTQNLIREKLSENSLLGVLDLGSAAMRFDIYKIKDNHSKIFNLIDKKRYLLRLGAREENGEINKQKKEATENACREVRKILDQLSIKTLACVATESLRAAKNGVQISKCCSEILGFNLKILTPDEEAKLTSLGICFFENINNFNLNSDQEIIFIDIGGGSTEISKHKLNNHGQLLLNKCLSTKVGVIKGGLDPEELSSIITELKITPGTNIVGSSGTFRSILEIYKNFNNIKNNNLSSLLKEEIEEIIYLSKKMSKEEYFNFTEPAANRRDLLPKGFEIVSIILKEINPKKIHVSKFSLRHGLLAEMISNNTNLPYENVEPWGWKVE